MHANPSAAVLVLNYNGVDHLRICLPSLERLRYPHKQLVVVDNGSTDGSAEYVRSAHPAVRLIALGRNKGFTGAYNEAIRAVDAEWVALLNNDTRVDEGWLDELVATADRHQAASAAAAIIDWDGSRVDFVGGLPTFTGHAWQIDYGQPVGSPYAERPILFGCGGAVLVHRQVFLASGGFDDDYFIYFEDVDLGWRLAVMGHPTVFAPRAVTYHRLHGTTHAWAPALRLRLYERNALATIFKNYGDEALARVLPAAVALTIGRNIEQAKLDGRSVAFGARGRPPRSIPPQLAGVMIALEDFADWLPRLRERRSYVQRRRAVPDSEILALMPEPLKLHDIGDRYREPAEALIRDFRIAELFGLPVQARVGAGATAATGLVVHTADLEGPEDRHMADGPEITTFAPGPTVSVIVLTASGPRHLPECLTSLAKQDWPADRLEVVVVDNGSRRNPTRVVQQHYRTARVVRTGRNLGFSAGNNRGAHAARGEWLLFVNDDTRLDPACVSRLFEVATRRGAAAVGARILDWTGARIDFAGGLVNFEGRGYPVGWDADAATFPTCEQPLLFGCGAAVMFRRDAFEDAGGWDEPTFAYYEDVEFGWRLWLLGHEVWFAPQAIVYHQHHGTSGPESPARLRAFERNALRMIYALLEERTLRHALPAALLLAVDRLTLATPFSRAAEGQTGTRRTSLTSRGRPSVLRARLAHALSRRGARRNLGVSRNLARVGVTGLVGSGFAAVRDVAMGWELPPARDRFLIERASPDDVRNAQLEAVPPATVAGLLGIRDFLRMLPELSDRRAGLQARRRRTDAEIIGRFGSHWRSAVPSPHIDLHVASRRHVLDVLSTVLQALPPELVLSEVQHAGVVR